MCTISYGNAWLKITPTGSTFTTRPVEFGVYPAGAFIQAFAATTEAVPPIPATTIGTPVRKWGHGVSRFHP